MLLYNDFNSLVFLRPMLVAKFNYKKHKKLFFKPFSARLVSKFVKGANTFMRKFLVFAKFQSGYKKNSFSLEDWCCVSCDKNHPLLPRASEQRIWGGGRQLIFLTDHNMPAILPSKDGKCPIIIRVDGGLLREIGTNFLLRISGFAVPEGSVVVIGSVTHLMEEGRVGYTKALVTEYIRFSKAFKGSVHSCLSCRPHSAEPN